MLEAHQLRGLSAKPIIDIDRIIPNYDCFEDVVKQLNEIGYEHEGNLGIKDREAFKYSEKSHLMTHHLYVCPQKSEELKRHIIFRNYLRRKPEAVYTYSKVKESAAQLFPNNINKYIEYKSDCIENLYRNCGLI